MKTNRITNVADRSTHSGRLRPVRMLNCPKYNKALFNTQVPTVDVRLYRRISNLSILSKLLERLVVQRCHWWITWSSNFLSQLQSGFGSGYSTETAVLPVLSGILQAVDRGDVAALMLLDLSAAFHAIDHIIIQRLYLVFYMHYSHFYVYCI